MGVHTHAEAAAPVIPVELQAGPWKKGPRKPHTQAGPLCQLPVSSLSGSPGTGYGGVVLWIIGPHL